MKTRFLRFVLAAIIVAAGIVPAMAQTPDDLQAYLDKLVQRPATRAGEPSIVDLSEFGSTTRSTTLTVSGEINVKFINGTLTRTRELDGPVLAITGNSTVDWGEGAELSCGGFKTDHELVNVNNGTFIVSEGKLVTMTPIGNIVGPIVGPITRATPPQYLQETAVLMETGKNSFIMTGGEIDHYGNREYGNVICNQTDAYISITGGSASLKTKSDVHVSGETNLLLYMLEGAVVCVDGELQSDVTIRKDGPLTGGDVMAKGSDGYELTEADGEKIKVKLENGSAMIKFSDGSVIVYGLILGDNKFPHDVPRLFHLNLPLEQIMKFNRRLNQIFAEPCGQDLLICVNLV